MIENLSQLVAAELRKRGNKSVKSLFWNADQGNLSVFARNHTADKPKGFNYAPETHFSVELFLPLPAFFLKLQSS